MALLLVALFATKVFVAYVCLILAAALLSDIHSWARKTFAWPNIKEEASLLCEDNFVGVWALIGLVAVVLMLIAVACEWV